MKVASVFITLPVAIFSRMAGLVIAAFALKSDA